MENEVTPTQNEQLKRRDLAVLWHPCTQMKDHEYYPLIPIRRGEGVWLYDFDGRRYIDAISSWWVNIFGHSNPAINAALTEQAGQLEHVIFAGFSHEPAIRLAERLVAITPTGLDRVFFWRQRIIGDRNRAEDELSLLEEHRQAKQNGVCEPGQQLPRRNLWSARGR